MFRTMLLGALLLGLLAAPGFAGPDYYLRNRALKGRVAGGEVYVTPGALGTWLKPEEVARIQVQGGQVLVDGNPVAAADEAGAVPLVQVAKALGFQVRPNPEMGQVDLVPPKALLSHTERATASGLDPNRRPEYRMSAAKMQRVLALLPRVQDKDMEERLKRLGDRVVAATPLAGLPWNFYIVHERSPNAACVGEGHVFVTLGLMDLGLSDDELAGVLGHEIAHGVRRHPFLLMDMAEEMASLGRQVQALGNRTDANFVSQRNQAEELVKRLESLQYRLEHDRAYDRAAEEEADILGLQYAVNAGFSPDGLGRALQRLEASSVQEFGSAVLDEDMSHPPVTRRLEILRRVQQGWKR